jgi:hypothetical protein
MRILCDVVLKSENELTMTFVLTCEGSPVFPKAGMRLVLEKGTPGAEILSHCVVNGRQAAMEIVVS